MELYRRAPHLLVRRYAGEVILGNPTDTELQLLSGTSAAVWDLLDAPRTTEFLTLSLTKTYAGPIEAVRADVDRLLADLVGRGLVEREPGHDG